MGFFIGKKENEYKRMATIATEYLKDFDSKKIEQRDIKNPKETNEYRVFRTFYKSFYNIVAMEPLFKYMSFEDRLRTLELYLKYSEFNQFTYQEYMTTLAESTVKKISSLSVEDAGKTLFEIYKDYNTMKKYLFPYVDMDTRKVLCDTNCIYQEEKAKNVKKELVNIVNDVKKDINKRFKKTHRTEEYEIYKYLKEQYNDFDQVRINLFPFMTEDQVKYVVYVFDRYKEPNDKIPTYDEMIDNYVQDKYNDSFQSFDEYKDELASIVKTDIIDKANEFGDESTYSYILNRYMDFEGVQTYLYPYLNDSDKNYVEQLNQINNGRTR